MVAPVGTVQLYVTPVTAVTEYTKFDPLQTFVTGPLIAQGLAGAAVFVTQIDLAEQLLPKQFDAFTDIVPVVNAVVAVTVIVAVF